MVTRRSLIKGLASIAVAPVVAGISRTDDVDTRHEWDFQPYDVVSYRGKLYWISPFRGVEETNLSAGTYDHEPTLIGFSIPEADVHGYV